MKFYKILGKCDSAVKNKAEKSLSSIITELAMDYNVRSVGSHIGGDIFLYQLVSALPHICDARSIELDEAILNIISDSSLSEIEKEIIIYKLHKNGVKLVRTAATNGKVFYWCPKFVISKSKIGLRLVVAHEAHHVMYMHPARRGSRNPDGWNKSVDFKVNFNLIDDLRSRKVQNPEEVFKKELGDFVNIDEYASFLKDPFSAHGKMARWNPINIIKFQISEKEPDNSPLYFAEPFLPKNLQKPEAIYDYLLSQVPKCGTCGKLGICKKPEEYKKLEKMLKEKEAK